VYTTTSSILSKPTSIKDALANPEWLHAMQKEYEALLANNTWTLISLPPSATIGYK